MIIIKRPLTPGEKQDMTLFFESLKGDTNHMTFDSFFYDSEETGQTVDALISLLQQNPNLPKVLCLMGANSSGKTHLLHAIKSGSCQNVFYTTSDQLSLNLSQAISEDCVCAFIDTFSNMDILLIDDAQYLVTKEAMLDFLYDKIVPRIRQHVIMASDCDPQDIGILRGYSKVLKVELPSLEVRKHILQQRMDELNLVIDDALQHHIASKLTDPRQINGFLTYLKAVRKEKCNSISLINQVY